MSQPETKLTKGQAQKLFTEAHNGLATFENSIKRIVELKAWEPLGYTSFAVAWQAEFKDFRIAQDALKPVVLYAMFDAGMTSTDAADQLRGVTARTAEAVKTQYDAGIPLARATPWGVTKRDDPETHPIIATVSTRQWEQCKNLSAGAGSTLTKEAELAVRTWFKLRKKYPTLRGLNSIIETAVAEYLAKRDAV